MSASLPVRMVEKPWGRDVLPAPFTAPLGHRIGHADDGIAFAPELDQLAH